MIAARMIGRLSGGDESDIILKAVNVKVRIIDFSASVEVVQCYVNKLAVPVEATYHFPLDSGAAITKCVLSVEGRIVKAALQEKEQARETYDRAIASGQAAALVEEDADMPDVFTCSLGNLPAGADAEVRITYVTTLAIDDSEHRPRLRFTLPTAVAPRYTPAGGGNGSGGSGSGAGSAGPYGDGGYRMDVDVDARLASACVSVSSPSHPLTTDQCTASPDGTASVRLRGLRLERDLVLLFGCEKPHEPRAWLTPPLLADGTRAVAVALLPDLLGADFDNDALGEFIFVIDRSGSMSGGSIEAAKQALILSVSALPLGSTFNIVSFGSSFEKAFPASTPFTDASKEDAIAKARAMDADLGGTEILVPLQDLALTEPDGRRPRQVVVITDGQVSNTRQVIDFVKEQHAKTGARFFTCGIGGGVSHALVNGIARAGGGAAEFIAESAGNGIKTKVMRLVNRALQPTITGAVVDYGSLPVVRIAPCKPPPIYAGCLQMLFGLLRPSDSAVAADYGGSVVTVRMRGPDGEMVQRVPLLQPFADASSAEDKAAAAQLYASAVRAMLRDLEEDGEEGPDLGAVGGRDGNGEAPAASAENRKKTAVALSMSAGVKCRWTSFVAVEERVNVGSGNAPLAVQVPIDIKVAAWPADAHGGGYGGSFGFARAMACAPPPGGAMICCSAAAPSPSASQSMSAASAKYKKSSRSVGGGGLFGAIGGLISRSSGSASNGPPTSRAMVPPLPPPAPQQQQQERRARKSSASVNDALCLADCADESDDCDVDFKEKAEAEECCASFDCSARDEDAMSAPVPPPPPSMPMAAAAPLHAAPARESSKGGRGGGGGGASVASSNRSVTDIAALQRVDGSWAASAEVLAWLGLSAAAFKQHKPAEMTSDDWWATALVLALLVGEMQGLAEQWQPSARKARRFLKNTAASQPDDEQLAKWLAIARSS